MNTPIISVVMSVFNGEKYLREAIESILNQTFDNFEFIIINDGSTDNTSNILRSYPDNRIIIIDQGNVGLTRSLNRGIESAKGMLIARQDADDRSFPDRLARQFAFLRDNERIALVGSAVEVISSAGSVMATYRHPVDPEEIRQSLFNYNCFWHGSVMFRREAFIEVGGYFEEFNMAEDYELWLRFNEKYLLANIPEPLYAYRFTTGSITVQKMAHMHRLADLARQIAVEKRDVQPERRDSAKVKALLASPLTAAEKKELIKNYKSWCMLLIENGLTEEAAQLMAALFRHHHSTIFRLAFGIGRHIKTQKTLARFLEHA